MDRLTYRAYPSGKAYLEYGLDAIWKKKLKTLRYDIIEKAVDRLAEYEDTGLAPAEVAELAQAKADGRLVVLPCKLRSKVYDVSEFLEGRNSPDIYELETDEITIKRVPLGEMLYEIECCEYRDGDFGKTVFLSREEAEKALKEM